MYRRESSSKEYIDPSRFKEFKTLVSALYSLYYKSTPNIEEPENIMRREFAFQYFDMDSYVRHLSFDTYEELLEFLAEKNPRHAYYSIAEYELPEAKSMEEKNWLGSDLLFDLDLDYLEYCKDKRVEGDKGYVLDDSCYQEGYRLMLRLKSMIKRDLSPEDIIIYFTGHRGFHMRVICEECRGLGKTARRELALYFAGQEVDPYLIFPSVQVVKRGRRKTRLVPALPEETDPGWRGWIAQYIYDKKGKSLVDVFGESWEYEVLKIISEISVPIDVMVTQDPSRLTRIIGSLHGKGHLLVTDVSSGLRLHYSRLSPFKGWVRVEYLQDVENITFMGVELSGQEKSRAEIPASIALHLAEKGIVRLLGGEIYV
ncbi:MAG: hypothetical protein GSR77_02355 [Desulfurococcales archaeon]|nr:hypothetical protein [Desulfurococcales archaeon]